MSPEPVVSIAQSPDERHIIASALDGAIRLINKENGSEMKR